MKTESLGMASSLEVALTSLCIIPSHYITDQQSFGAEENKFRNSVQKFREENRHGEDKGKSIK